MHGHEEQAAKNELAFRRVNDAIDRLDERWHKESMVALCECGDVSCLSHFDISPHEYERVRSENHFLVLPGHEQPDAEHIIAVREKYVVVEKPLSAVTEAERDS
jgi:hypothetical protein